MAKAEDRIKLLLDENRMLILVVQVLIGFGYQGVYQPRFMKLSAAGKLAGLSVFGFLIMTLALLLMIPAYHRIALEGRESSRLVSFAESASSTWFTGVPRLFAT